LAESGAVRPRPSLVKVCLQDALVAGMRVADHPAPLLQLVQDQVHVWGVTNARHANSALDSSSSSSRTAYSVVLEEVARQCKRRWAGQGRCCSGSMGGGYAFVPGGEADD
jgi:hypothetical protein